MPPWASKPEFYVSIFLTVILFILSLYGPEIRRVIDTRPTKTRNWWRSVWLGYYRQELDTLNRRHNNAYELVLYALTQIGQMAVMALVLGFLGMFLALRPSLGLTSDQRALVIILYFAPGPFMIAAALAKILIEFRHLNNYEKRVAYLEKKVAALIEGDKPQ